MFQVKTLSLIGLLTLGLLASSSAEARKELNLQNLDPDTKNELIKRFPYLDGGRTSLDQVDEVIRYLQLKPQVETIRVFDDGGNIPYRLDIKKTRRISSVAYSGVTRLSSAEFDNNFGVKSGDPFDEQALIEGGERIRQAYKGKGFLNTIVDIEMPPESDDLVGVKVTVSENRQTHIQNISLASPNENLNKALGKELGRYLDEPLTEGVVGKIQSRAQEYLRRNRYVRAELRGPELNFSSDEGKVVLNFHIDKPEQYSFEFFGIPFLEIRKVEKILDLDNFYSANPQIGSEVALKIRNDYWAKGYARVEVKATEVEGKNPFEKIVRVNIDEGPLVRIEEFKINGRISRRERYYVNFIKEHSSELIENGYYNKDDLDVGLKNMILQMQNSGYLQAKILSTRSQYNSDKTAISIFVNLDEGPLSEIKSVTFSGNKDFSSSDLIAATRIQEGPLRLNQLEASIIRLKEFYHNNGYIEMQLLNEKQDLVTYDDTNTEASLHFRILEGPKVNVSSIILEGNSFTKDYVLLQELDFRVGEVLTPHKIEESIARLQRTGFFGTVEIRTLEEKTNVSQRTILVKVSEREPGLFTLGAGATNERTLTLRGYTGIGYRNLFGTGRGVSLRLEGNYNVTDIRYMESRVVLGYIEPYIFNTRVRGRLNITRSATVTDFDLRQVSQVNSATVSVEQDFTSHILGIWDLWSLATIRDFGLDERYPFGEFTQDIATTGPTLDLDFRDNPFNPTRGTFTRLSSEYSAPWLGSSQYLDMKIEYWKAVGSFTHYQPIIRWRRQPIVWANQLRAGYLKNLSDMPRGGIPWDKKGFILGGQTTIRGYEAGTQEVFPNRQDLGLSASDRTYYLQSDSTMFIIKSELRFPVYNSIGGAIFYDGGSVQIQGLDFPDSYRDSAGFGFRYNTPVGPVSLDFAWKLDMRPNEEPWRFHLSIGSF